MCIRDSNTSTVFAVENLEDATTYEIEVYITDDQVDTTETSSFTTSTQSREVTVSSITSDGATFTTTSLINSDSRPAYWRYGIHGSDVWGQTLQTTADSDVNSGAATLTVSNLVPETRYRVEANLAVDSWDSSTNIIDRTSFTTSAVAAPTPVPSPTPGPTPTPGPGPTPTPTPEVGDPMGVGQFSCGLVGFFNQHNR